MKRLVICSILAVYLLSLSAAGAASAADRGDTGLSVEYNEAVDSSPKTYQESDDSNRKDKVVMWGCDESAWETSTGIDKAQVELNGTWTGSEADLPGQWSITFTYSGRFELKGPDEEYSGRYLADSERDPKLLNLYIKESSDPVHVGKTAFMIYKADAGTLTFASGVPGVRARPGSFAPGNGVRLFIVAKRQ